jgi:hypothetical protein
MSGGTRAIEWGETTLSTDSLRDPPLTPACRAASLFIEHLNSHNFEGIGQLFADPTDVTGPDGSKYHRGAEVVAFMRRGFKAMTTHWRFRIANVVPVGKNGCLLQFEVSEDDGPFEAVAVDHIELNSEGKIIRFLPYVAANRVAKTVELQKKVKAAG